MDNTVSVSFNDEPPGCICESEIEQFVLTVLDSLKKKYWEVSVLFCNDNFIQELNRQYRNIDLPTDILSFEQGDEYFDDKGNPRYSAGDIVISLDSLLYNSKEFQVSANEELKRLLIHGLLHLSGMDHIDNSPDEPMLKLQEAMLSSYKNIIIYRE